MKSEKPHDTLAIEAVGAELAATKLPAYLYRESLRPRAGATVAGRYGGDNAPGLIVNGFGKGRSIYCGALAGMAYLTPAMTTSSQILPTAFPDALRSFIAAPAALAGVARPVVASDPLVEAQYFTGPRGDVVVLINWRDQPVTDLVVTFPGKGDLKTVRSLRQAGYFTGHLDEQARGGLEITTTDGTPRVSLGLEVSDYLLVD